MQEKVPGETIAVCRAQIAPHDFKANVATEFIATQQINALQKLYKSP
jgi:hypothetical protein